MLIGLVEAILPGTRNLRPPLISGLLWAIFAWLVVSPKVPDQDEASGTAKQLYDLANFVGPAATVIIGSVLIFVLGAATGSATALLARLLGPGQTSIRRRVQWQWHARRRVRELLRSLTDQRGEIDKSSAGANPSRAQIKSLEGRISRTKGQLEVVEKNRWKLSSRLIRDNEETRRALGNPGAQADSGLEGQIISRAHNLAVLKQAEDLKLTASLDEIEDASMFYRRSDDLVTQLVSELHPDPLDALRALDEKLYLELERERAERELRVAISLPLGALGLFGSVQFDHWWSVVTCIATVLLLRNALDDSTEKTRVLNLIEMRELHTPAIRAAAAYGRADVMEFLSAKARKEASEADRRETTP